MGTACFWVEPVGEADPRLWSRPGHGDNWTDRTLPPGAMFDATWLGANNVGPDGISLTVVLPPERKPWGDDVVDNRNSWWHVDQSRQDGGWSRTGDPRRPGAVSAQPSIKTSHYHGFLQAGTLTDDLGDHIGD